MNSSNRGADVALLTAERYIATSATADDWYLNNILADDRLLQNELLDLGLTSQRVAWSDPRVDWSLFRCAVFRTTWDYYDRLEQFSAWLDRAARMTQLCNPLPMIRWNLDKHYLEDLQSRGVRVVPTQYIERGSSDTLASLIASTGWDNAVVKPCVSGGARHTYRVNNDNAEAIDRIIGPLLETESFLLQPFQSAIVHRGEITLILADGQVTHGVRKLAKAGDFRVQDDHGGTVQDHCPTAAEIKLARQAIAACDAKPVYGRVDMVSDESGEYQLMELELIEPELWLRLYPPAAKAIARAIAAGILA